MTTDSTKHSIEEIYDIPLSFVYLRIEDEFSCIPAIKYLGTLINSGANDIQTLFKGGLKQTKKLKDVQKGISEHIDLVYDVYHSGVFDAKTGKKVIVVPYNYDSCEDFASKMAAFAKDFHEAIMKYDDRWPESRKAFTTTITERYLYSPTHPDPKSIDDIAVLIGCTRQNVEDKYKKYRKNAAGLLEGKTYENLKSMIIADPRLITDFSDFCKRVDNTISVETFKRKSGIEDGKTLLFLGDVMGLRISESVDKKSTKIPCVSKHSLISFDRNIGKLLAFFRDEVIHIRYEIEFKSFLNRTFGKDPDLMEMFDSLVCHSDEFIWDVEDGKKVVALRWDLLEFLSPELCWILYENDITDFKSAVSASKLVSLYNVKARYYGKPTISTENLTSHLQRDCWRVMAIAKSGYWKLRKNKTEKFDIDKYASDYVVNVSANDMDGFLDKADRDGVSNIYNINGLRTAYNRNGGSSVGHHRGVNRSGKKRKPEEINDIMDFTEEILLENNCSMQMTVLSKEIRTLFPDMCNVTFANYVEGHSDRFDILKRDGNLSSIVTLKNHKHIVPESYGDKIRKGAIVDILCSEDKAVERDVIYSKYIGYVPTNLRAMAAISKIFGDEDVFIRKPNKDGVVMISLTRKALSREMVNMHEAISRDAEMKKYLKLLQDAPSYDWKNLRMILYREFAPVFADYKINLSLALNNMYYIMSNGKEVTKDSTFHELLSALPDYYNGVLASDRAYHLSKDVILNFETFLKNFYMKKNGADVVQDIRDEWMMAPHSIGLSTICRYLEDTTGILPYKAWYSHDPNKIAIKEIVNNLITVRNHTAGHPDDIQDKKPETIKQRIKDALTIYFYVASQL
ncbi:MAG: hypothetical protein MJZ16_12260 [Bacteroidales bacterium]|nr:hypothetical protein [Bacteroidales bacterium]